MRKTEEEENLLVKLANGLLDGPVGDVREYRCYRTIYCGKYIMNGEPVSYKESEPIRLFNGKENELVPERREEERFSSEERKLEFLQRFGWLIDDDDVRKYSAKFKPKK